VARWHRDGRWAGFDRLAEACSLASAVGRVWAGGRVKATLCGDAGEPRSLNIAALHLDNHWLLMPPR
jgi:hypothetical protein